MKKFIYSLLTLLIFAGKSMAQMNGKPANNSVTLQKVQNLEEQMSALPYYSYRKGLGFTTPDSLYQVNIRFRMQSRGTYAENNDEEGSIDGQIRRLRLRFDGYVGSPKITYAIQLSFAPGDLGGPVQVGENLNIIRDAVVFYNFNNKWSIGFGQTKLPGNRQRVNSSGALQLTDRTINNALFNIDRDFGSQIYYNHQIKNAFSYNFKGAISQGEGRNFTSNSDLNLAYTAKVEVFPMGDFKNNGTYTEGDLLKEETPKFMLSAAYQFNQKAKKSQGQLGEVLFDPRDLHSVFVDAIFKYRGFAFMTAYMQRYTKYPLTFNPSNWLQNDFVMAGHGFDFQSSYMLPKDYEIIARYSTQKMQEQIRAYRPDAQQITLGLTRYIWEHTFKLQAEATYNVTDYFDNTQKDNWYFRFQVELGI